ncbi:hypothetical protein DEU56DRAFT_916242 [Suillus clintonianus]|uniref:uncharacterized protein n=1 Tax=Suillus clintonianus TaxID=1904413 RepID=UPI001B886FAB|nr:uncharacterized protein DEU56DRAFT_916242 [Suillus clintonianus]KAG2125961.1 hypothetical protein DEU56DRAFT_916242 [Suillus clintonianus]
MSHSDIRCPHNRPVQMLPHPCFRLKQFIEAIWLVQCRYVPPQAPGPYGWPYCPEGEDCLIHAQHDGDSLTNVTDDNTDISVDDTDCGGLADQVAEDHADVSIDDIWIGPADDVADDADDDSSLQSDPLTSGGEEDAPEYQAIDANASVETLVDIDPASRYNWFVSVGHSGVGLFSDIYTAPKMCATGTSVYYFSMLDAAREHLWRMLNMWCGEATML